MDPYYTVVNVLRTVSLLAGGMVIFLGIMRATVVAGGARSRGRVARQIGDHASLGLEFFVAATILNLILNPAWMAVAATAVTIAVRQLITRSLWNVAREGRGGAVR